MKNRLGTKQKIITDFLQIFWALHGSDEPLQTPPHDIFHSQKYKPPYIKLCEVFNDMISRDISHFWKLSRELLMHLWVSWSYHINKLCIILCSGPKRFIYPAYFTKILGDCRQTKGRKQAGINCKQMSSIDSWNSWQWMRIFNLKNNTFLKIVGIVCLKQNHHFLPQGKWRFFFSKNEGDIYQCKLYFYNYRDLFQTKNSSISWQMILDKGIWMYSNSCMPV